MISPMWNFSNGDSSARIILPMISSFKQKTVHGKKQQLFSFLTNLQDVHLQTARNEISSPVNADVHRQVKISIQ